jgi:2-phospho-L-lactate guanylyltransferase
MPPTLWIVVLIKDFRIAKSRLSPAMEPEQRRALAEMTAARALDAALAVGPTLAVCGSVEAADLARSKGANVLLESEPGGQNPAARRGLDDVARRGAESALVMSSDLPLVDADGLRRMLAHAEGTGAIAVAASAAGRQGTNALFLRPCGDFDLHFGAASLPRFAQEATHRARRFVVHDDPALALDLDEPSDLSAWRELEPTA